jgi:hypothetical protein
MIASGVGLAVRRIYIVSESLCALWRWLCLPRHNVGGLMVGVWVLALLFRPHIQRDRQTDRWLPKVRID